MPVEYRKGDLFAQPDIDCIGHGVNTKGVMGAGIAVLFRRKYPDMYRQYVLWCDLGILRPGQSMPWETADNQGRPTFIFNIASQNEPGKDATLDWLQCGVNQAIVQARQLGRDKLAIPRIGAGIGGLTWEDTKKVYEELGSIYSNFTLVVVSLPGA